jgi:hypothetical protein
MSASLTHILWYNVNKAMIEEIKGKFADNAFEFSKHATDQSILRGISVQEIRQAISVGEIKVKWRQIQEKSSS